MKLIKGLLEKMKWHDTVALLKIIHLTNLFPQQIKITDTLGLQRGHPESLKAHQTHTKHFNHENKSTPWFYNFPSWLKIRKKKTWGDSSAFVGTFPYHSHPSRPISSKTLKAMRRSFMEHAPSWWLLQFPPRPLLRLLRFLCWLPWLSPLASDVSSGFGVLLWLLLLPASMSGAPLAAIFVPGCLRCALFSELPPCLPFSSWFFIACMLA